MSKSDKFVAVGLALIIALIMRTCVMVEGATEKIPTLNPNVSTIIKQENEMQSKVTKWCYQVGESTAEMSIETIRGVMESLESWCDRHDTAVAAAMKKHPPVPC